MYRKIDQVPFMRNKLIEARRQVDAASAVNMTVEWKVNDRVALEKFTAMFKAEVIPITVKFLSSR